MADSFLSIYVDDTSPTVAYAPFADTFGEPDLSAGWNPYYSVSGYAASLGRLGEGTSSHRTSLDGASLSIQWAGTGIQLLGNASQAGFNLTVDGRPAVANSSSIEQGVLAEFYDLHDSNHTITLTVNTDSQSSNESFVAFDKALFNSTQPTASTSMIQTTLNDTNVAFLGQWSFFSDVDDDGHTCSFHKSENSGDRMEFTVQGSAITIFGLTSPNSGSYNVTIDNHSTVHSAHSSFTQPYTLLYYATELDDSVPHAIVVQNMENKTLAMSVGGINYTSAANSPSSSIPHPTTKSIDTPGTKAAIALSCILFALLILGLGYFVGYRPRARRREDQFNLTTRLEKEAEAGAAVLDISQNSARLGSTGTRFSFARLGLGRGAARSASDLDIDMMTDLDSAGSVRQVVRKNPHSQWEAYTISMPSIRYGPPSPLSSRFSSHRSPLPSPTTVPANVHTRHDSGARLLNQGRSADRDDDADSSKNNDSDYDDPVEINLSPRTSEAQSYGSPRSPQSTVPYLTYEEPTPVDEQSGDQRGAGKPSNKFWRRSGSSRRLSAPVTAPMSSTERSRRTSQDGSKRLSSVRFDASALQPPSTVPRHSFLDFSSSASSSTSSGTYMVTPHIQGTQGAPPAMPAISKPIVKGPRPLPSIAVSVPLGMMPSQPSHDDALHPPYPRSFSVSPVNSSGPGTETCSTPTPPDYEHIQYFSPIAPPSSPPVNPLPPLPAVTRPSGPAPLNVVSSTDRYNPQYRGVEDSPTDSFARSVSDINFRHISASTTSSRRTSAHQGQYAPVVHRPLIVQKILGMQAPRSSPEHSEALRASPSRLEPLRRVEEPEIPSPSPSTPFMQRVLRIGGGHDRGGSQASFSVGSEASLPTIHGNTRRS